MTRALASLLAAAATAAGWAASEGSAIAQDVPVPPPPEPPTGFELTSSTVRPARAFLDAKRAPRLTYRFSASEPMDVAVELTTKHRTVETWTQLGAEPFVPQAVAWDGQGGPDGGRLSFRVGPVGGVARPAGRFRLFDHAFPLPGRHSYGDRFGVPRSGGRVHEGQDLWASCGATLIAARGGTVQAKGYSAALYGHYVTIDGTATERDYFYAHLASPTPLSGGDRVRTGQRIGAVGRTGNAAGEGCQLHFELWPSGWRDGHPIDPLRELRRWDGWS
jgi:murein DD-endopeptidase MepM/ murein hydrolase activator NlpD